MNAFRILLALALAGATFYSLNVLAVQNGYGDRLDFKNRHYHENDCRPHHEKPGFSHHNRTMAAPVITPIDSTNNK